MGGIIVTLRNTLKLTLAGRAVRVGTTATWVTMTGRAGWSLRHEANVVPIRELS